MSNLLTADFDRIVVKIQKYLLDGHIIDLDDDTSIRWAIVGQTFDDGNYSFEALNSGVYKRCPTLPPSDRIHWLYFGGIEVVSYILEQHFSTMTFEDREKWYIGVLASMTLRSLAHQKW